MQRVELIGLGVQDGAVELLCGHEIAALLKSDGALQRRQSLLG